MDTTTSTPSSIHTATRTPLRLDALASGALGVLLLALASVLDELLGLPPALSIGVGAGLVAWALLVAWVAREARPALVKEVVALNVVWVVGSFVLVLADPVGLTGLGTAFVVVQSLAVAAITTWQVVALAGAPAGCRRPARDAPPDA